jgi:hypothetical protein
MCSLEIRRNQDQRDSGRCRIISTFLNNYVVYGLSSSDVPIGDLLCSIPFFGFFKITPQESGVIEFISPNQGTYLELPTAYCVGRQRLR